MIYVNRDNVDASFQRIDDTRSLEAFCYVAEASVVTGGTFKVFNLIEDKFP